jgi:hypothetical protein
LAWEPLNPERRIWLNNFFTARLRATFKPGDQFVSFSIAPFEDPLHFVIPLLRDPPLSSFMQRAVISDNIFSHGLFTSRARSIIP